MDATPIGHVDVTSGTLLVFDFGLIGVFEEKGSAKAQTVAAFEMGQTELAIHGYVTGVAVRGLTPGRYPISCDRLDDGDFAGLRRSITIDFASAGKKAARTIELGNVFVDCARIGVFDVSAIDAWNHVSPTDGRADIVFWGLHGAEVATRFEAPQLPDGNYGFVDRPVDEAIAVAEKLRVLRETGELRFAFDFRPHTDDFFLLREIRTSAAEAGTIAVGGQTVCGLMTTWGDGLFPATLEVDENDTPLRCMVTFATERSVENMRAVNGM